jgi:hypothetical protein
MNDREFLDTFQAELDRKLEKDSGDYRGFSPIERLAALRQWFQWEVSNGGLETYFFNSAGDHAVETSAMLRKIGALEAADILDRAIALSGVAGPSRDTHERREQLESLSAEQQRQLSELTDAYFTAENEGLETADLLDRYLLEQRRTSAG